MSSRSARVSASRERRRAAGGIPPRGNNKQRMQLCGLPKARPISCNDCPDFQRLQISVLCVRESLDRFPWVIDTILKLHVYQMVLHRPIECTRLTRHNVAVGGGCKVCPWTRRSFLNIIATGFSSLCCAIAHFPRSYFWQLRLHSRSFLCRPPRSKSKTSQARAQRLFRSR